ncbi:response regulator [Paenibacillus sp. LMG 31456]|uniref:Circadian input-output histidine kinase CikA n=1 Tax=Paenibacillus foliorum TaxID=2654974 RepID=A0A972GSI6_9BACL|nr:response regulator [Paenibacillus foliorum]NOU93659.1 response regulator [Paenibacillus foliorum]
MANSLRIKWVLLLVVITTICLSIVGAVNYSLAKEKMISYIQQLSLTAVQDTSKHLNDWLNIRYAEAKVISRTNMMKKGTLEEKLNYLRQEVIYSDNVYYSAGISDLEGNLSLTNGDTLNISANTTFKLARKGQGLISDPFFGQAGEYIITIILPVWDDSGRMICLLQIALDANKVFSEQLKGIDPNHAGGITLIHRDATILYSGHKELILKNNFPKDFPDLEPVHREIIDKGTGYQLFNFQGKSLLLFYSKVGSTPWYLLFNVSEATLNKPLESLFFSTVGLIALMELVLASLIYFVFNTMIIRRIHDLLIVTEAVAGGNLSVAAIETKSRDELGLLSLSVNEMTQNLRDLFEPFESFVGTNQLAMIVLDKEFRIVSLNHTAENMLGYRARDVVQLETPLLWHDPVQLRERASAYSVDLGIPVEPDCSVLAVKPMRKMEMDQDWTYIRSNGSRLAVSLNVSLMTHPDGSLKGFVMLARDMSSFLQATETSNRLLHILDAAQDFIASFDLKGNMFYINAAGKQLLEIDVLDEDSRLIGNYLQTEMSMQLAEGLVIAQQHGHWEGETEFVTRKGGCIVTSQVIVAHKPSDGGDVFFSTIVRDIMDQKQIQSELVQAKEAADSANQAKSMFLASMSHEIRTPLNGIMGLSYLMQQTKLTDIQRDYLSKISSSAQTLLQVINDILDFSKIEANKLTLEKASFQLDETLRKLNSTLSVLLGHKPIDMIIRLEGEIPAVLIGDTLRLEQILLNLISNAIKFTDSGSVTLLIRVVDHKDEEAAVRFSITDTGIGMTPEQMNLLLQPFMQADQSISRKFGGTGLGLIISKNMIEMMGGSLSIESELGAGSTFSFTIRFVSPNPTRKLTFPLSKYHDDFRIHIVEDSLELRTSLSMMINSLSLQTESSDSWTHALNRLEWEPSPVHVLLLDMEAQDMYGEETWLQMKQAANRREALTIIYTTLAGRDALQRLPDNQRPDAILVKPISRLELYHSIAALQACYQVEAPAHLDLSGQSRPLAGHVLLIEDQAINQTVATAMLEALGVSVTVASHGLEALELLPVHHFDLILTDIHMPELDGLATTERIRLNSRYAHTPIIAITADVTKALHDQCLRVGMNGILTKPLEPDLLAATLSKWLPLQPYPAMTTETGTVNYEHLPELKGIDIQDAVQRLDGKIEIYVKLLALFRKEHDRTAAKLLNYINDGQLTEAKRLSHSLRGAAGNLGMKDVFTAAGTLELSIDEADTMHYVPLCKELETRLHEVFTSIDRKTSIEALQGWVTTEKL